jgi:hypothetical protein
MPITPFKGRAINASKPVHVYRNLTKECYSIMQSSRVVAHATSLCLRNCRMVVRERGRQATLSSGKKNVHAFIVGWMAPQRPAIIHRITYNPKRTSTFVNEKNTPIHSAQYVILREGGKVLAGEEYGC